MGLLRKDYVLDRWVYYAVSRKNRPHEFKHVEVKAESKNCVFCPKNEAMTPPEIGRVAFKDSWKMRWFLNKFSAVDKSSSTKLKSKKYLEETGTYGTHEIVVETPHHKTQLAELPEEDIHELIDVCRERIKALSKIKNIKYVQVFKNHGKNAGTSLVHSHTQVMALSMVPSLVQEKCDASRKKCPYCDVIKLESKSRRRIMETKSVIAFAPFASRFNYEAWIYPKRHVKTLEQLEPHELHDIAKAIKLVISKLKAIDASYNMLLHYAPGKENLHLHFEITPRTATWGGFEISTDAIINSVLPEDAAKFYREK
jgi:UDPglucose--hexose-1-phosphate uridylyltransferase